MPEWASRVRGLVALAAFALRLLRADTVPERMRRPADVRAPRHPATVPRAG